MEFSTEKITYRQTGFFSALVTDYLDNDPALTGLYAHSPDLEGIKTAMTNRAAYKGNRQLLADQLRKQYARMPEAEKANALIELLLSEHTFTVCTAHQPNLFTGHLYFIYKIVQAIKLSAELSAAFPDKNFIPVFYMGSEDADLEELGHIYLSGEKYNWETKQTGAVGRMKVDKNLVKLIDAISGQLSVHPFGEELMMMLKNAYTEGSTIEQATFHLIHGLFADYGLLVLLPDNPELKSAFIPVAEKELLTSFSHQAVAETIKAFPKKYKVQAGGRDINLFYLNENSRERIVGEDSRFTIHNSKLVFNQADIIEELRNHPERFSPNVILRPVFQEMILPNVAFIGGGGELAYWLELKKVFEAVSVPYPVLLLRNSFLFVEKKYAALTKKLQVPLTGIFKTEQVMMNEITLRGYEEKLSLENEKKELTEFYQKLQGLAGAIDPTLKVHTQALEVNAMKKAEALEKKMLRAAKKKMEVQSGQLRTLKNGLFPSGHLQERMDNLLPYYAKWGKEFIAIIYSNAQGMGKELGFICEK